MQRKDNFDNIETIITFTSKEEINSILNVLVDFKLIFNVNTPDNGGYEMVRIGHEKTIKVSYVSFDSLPFITIEFHVKGPEPQLLFNRIFTVSSGICRLVPIYPGNYYNDITLMLTRRRDKLDNLMLYIQEVNKLKQIIDLIRPK